MALLDFLILHPSELNCNLVTATSLMFTAKLKVNRTFEYWLLFLKTSKYIYIGKEVDILVTLLFAFPSPCSPAQDEMLYFVNHQNKML